MHRSRWILVAFLVLVGAVWTGQGLGLLRGSSPMVDDPFWAVAGLALVATGAVLAIVTVRRRSA